MFNLTRVRWEKRRANTGGWIGISYVKYDGSPSVSDPEGIATGVRFAVGLYFGTWYASWGRN
jgi:hypothetical protein